VGGPDISWCLKGGARGYVVTRALSWDIGKSGSGWVLYVEAGREFESSVPRLFRWFLSPDDPFFLKAAVVHDALLEGGCRPAFADSQWVEVALSEHAPQVRARLAFEGMRLRRFFVWLGHSLRF
jgi:hypothetical protein